MIVPKSKIMMVIDNFDPGGAQTLLIDLVKGLNKDKFDIDIVTLRKPEAFFDALANSAANVIELSGGKYNPFKFLSLIRLIKNNRVDVIHTHLTASRFLGVVAGSLGGAKRIFSHDHSGDEYLRKNKWMAKLVIYPLDRILMRFTDRILAVSEATANFNISYKKIPRQKVSVFPNWIDVSRFLPDPNDRQELRQLWQIPESAFVVGSVGRLSCQKGYRYLVEAAAEILAEAPETVFVIVGAGEELLLLKQLAQFHGVYHAFRFPGFISEVERVYPVFDLFCLPSLYEPFGLVVLEAMAAGLPVVASATGGVVEIVEDGHNGLLVSPGDTKALARGILTLMEHWVSLAEPMVTKAKQLVTTRFDRKSAIARIESLYLGEKA
jgi:glycosyltransferase involved in cell wall biosynthesis